MMNKNTTKQVGNVTLHSNDFCIFAFEVNGELFKLHQGVDIIDPQTRLMSVQGTIDYISEKGFSARILGPFGSGSPFYSFDHAAKYGTCPDDNASWKRPCRMKPVGIA